MSPACQINTIWTQTEFDTELASPHGLPSGSLERTCDGHGQLVHEALVHAALAHDLVLNHVVVVRAVDADVEASLSDPQTKSRTEGQPRGSQPTADCQA